MGVACVIALPDVAPLSLPNGALVPVPRMEQCATRLPEWKPQFRTNLLGPWTATNTPEHTLRWLTL